MPLEPAKLGVSTLPVFDEPDLGEPCGANELTESVRVVQELVPPTAKGRIDGEAFLHPRPFGRVERVLGFNDAIEIGCG